MSKIGRRFLLYFGLEAGLAVVALVALLLGRWLMPSMFGALPTWLPEDVLEGLGYLFGEELLGWVPALAFSAVILTFSFGLKPDELPVGEVSALVRFSVLAIVATVLFGILELLGQPWIDARLSNLEFRYNQTLTLENAYRAIKDRGASQQTPGDLDARLNLLKRLGTLRPSQNLTGQNERMDYDFELQILKAHLDLDEFFQLRALPGVEGEKIDAEASITELLERAEAVLADGTSEQEYQANFWGYSAYRRLLNASDQGQSSDRALIDRAKAVVDESWGRIYEKTLAADERLKASYFFRKGKSLGDFQFQNYLEAFYGFQELHHENPRDSEVTLHWELSREKIADKILFQQDMDVLFAVPGSENLVFLNRETPLDVVRVGKLLNTSQGVFLKDFEFLRADDRGRILLHWTAPYGRWTEAGIDFRVWDRDSPTPRFPIVLVETPGDEFNPEGDVDPPRFQPRVGVRDLEMVNARTPQPQTLSTMDLLVHGRAIEALGYNSRLFQTEFVVRLATPFAFFVGFLFTFALAWRNRAHQQGRSWWFLVALLPLVLEFVVQSFEWAGRLAVGGLLYFLGLEITSLTLAAATLVLSAYGLVLVHKYFEQSRV